MLLGLLPRPCSRSPSTAGSRAGAQRIAVVGAIPAIWPRFTLPAFDLRLLPDLVGIAFALTIVALGQSISIAKAVAARSGQHIDGNREFRGQGLSNIVGGLFSSYVSCGSLNRSFPNLRGGRANAARRGVRVALAAAAASRSARRLLALIPMAAIAALLLLIAWSLFDSASWRQLWTLQPPGLRRRRSDLRRDDVDPPRGRDPARHDPVAGHLPAPHVEAGDAHHGLRQHRRRRGRSSFAPTCPSRCPSARS